MRLALEIPDQTKLRQLMDFGSSFSLHVGEDYSLITIRALSRNLQPTLEILTAMFVEPLFSSLRIDGVKEQMRHLQKKETDDPNRLMRTLTARNFFGASGYGARLFGDEASLAAIGKKDIQAFFGSLFHCRQHGGGGHQRPGRHSAQTIADTLVGAVGRRPAGAARSGARGQGGANGADRPAPVRANPYRLRRASARTQQRRTFYWPPCCRPGWARGSAANCGRCATRAI